MLPARKVDLNVAITSLDKDLHGGCASAALAEDMSDRDEAHSMSAQLANRATEWVLRWPWLWANRIRNARAAGDCRILIVHSSLERSAGLRRFLRWTAVSLPELRQMFEFRLLSSGLIDLSRYRAIAFWGGATLVDRAPWLFRAALELTARAWTAGVPTINSADFWPNAVPTRAAKLLAAAGLRTPQIQALSDDTGIAVCSGDPTFPVWVREDRCQAADTILARDTAELTRARRRFRRPIAVESVLSGAASDRLRRTCQYLAIGEVGFSCGLQIELAPQVQSRSEQRALAAVYQNEFITAPNPHHSAFQEAQRVLGLPVVRFDYTYDRAGRLVVLRIDPLPKLHFSRRAALDSTKQVSHWAYAAWARLLCDRASFPEPVLVREILAELPRDCSGERSLRLAVAA